MTRRGFLCFRYKHRRTKGWGFRRDPWCSRPGSLAPVPTAWLPASCLTITARSPPNDYSEHRCVPTLNSSDPFM
ncbi:hypothetical protein BHE74_00054020 [Ensete ventricosum]|nr:hypothetical protein BHE74_00054020 [Ensete ventricosum]RZS20841.1 hypothetical protein BHM03_00053405 [Ensete ventricosum]